MAKARARKATSGTATSAASTALIAEARALRKHAEDLIAVAERLEALAGLEEAAGRQAWPDVAGTAEGADPQAPATIAMLSEIVGLEHRDDVRSWVARQGTEGVARHITKLAQQHAMETAGGPGTHGDPPREGEAGPGPRGKPSP